MAEAMRFVIPHYTNDVIQSERRRIVAAATTRLQAVEEAAPRGLPEGRQPIRSFACRGYPITHQRGVEMSSAAYSFKETEVKRTIKALRGSGLEVESLEVSRCGVIIKPKPAADKSAAPQAGEACNQNGNNTI